MITVHFSPYTLPIHEAWKYICVVFDNLLLHLNKLSSTSGYRPTHTLLDNLYLRVLMDALSPFPLKTHVLAPFPSSPFTLPSSPPRHHATPGQPTPRPLHHTPRPINIPRTPNILKQNSAITWPGGKFVRLKGKPTNWILRSAAARRSLCWLLFGGGEVARL